MGLWSFVVDGVAHPFEALGLSVGAALGAGMPPLELTTLPYATLDGAQFQRTRAGVRLVTLQVFLSGMSLADLHARKAALIGLLRRDRHDPQRPVTLRYSGAGAGPLSLDVYYDAGLELGQRQGWGEQLALRLLAPDPRWYGAATAAAAAASATTSTPFRTVGRRDEDGLWQVTGGPGGGLARMADGRVLHHQGGSVMIMEWPRGAAAPTTTSLGSVGSTVGQVIEGPGGVIYAAAAGGVFRRDAGSWTAIGSLTGTTRLAIDLSGRLLTVDTSNVVRRWDGSSWETLGASLGGQCRALAVGLDGALYAGGIFSGFVRRWDGSSWETLGALDNSCYTLAVGLDGALYAGGIFSGFVRRWDGSSWETLGGGLGGGSGTACEQLAVALDSGLLYAVGRFDSAGGAAVPRGLAAWNGQAWVAGDVDVGADGRIWGVTLAASGQIWAIVDGGAAGAITHAGVTTVTNAGSASVAPQIVIAAPAGGRLYLVRNARTGAAIYSDLVMLAGETVTIDCARKSMTSSYRGPILRHVSPGSQLGRWALLPGANRVGVLHASPAATCELRWVSRHWSLDG